MADVVSIDEAMPLAAGELAATVACDQRATGCRRDRASAFTDADRVTGGVIADGDKRTVAGEPASGLRRDARTIAHIAYA